MDIELLAIVCAVLAIATLAAVVLLHVQIKRMSEAQGRSARELQDLSKTQVGALAQLTGFAHVLDRVGAFAFSETPMYVQITSSSVRNVSENAVHRVAKSILDHIKEPDHPTAIRIQNIDPTYDFMERLVAKLPEGYVYLASSKLNDYGAISHPSFNRFRDTIEERVRKKQLEGYRLYYSVGTPSRRARAEMLSIANGKFRVRSRAMSEEEYDAANDYALIFAPRRRHAGHVLPAVTEGDPLSSLEEGYEFECAIRYVVDRNRRGGGQFVEEIHLLRPSSDEARRLKGEFERCWHTADVVLPPDDYRVFMSYRREDQEVVRDTKVQVEKQTNNGLRIWLDLDDMELGEEYAEVLDDAAQSIDHMVMFVSKHGLTNWQLRELDKWKDGGPRRADRKLLPVLLSGAVPDVLPPPLADRQRINYDDLEPPGPKGLAKAIVHMLRHEPLHSMDSEE